MELKIVVNSGDEAGATRKLGPGQSLRVGRTQPAELRLPDDAMLSSLHFSLTVQADHCLITDLGSKFGTQVNGQKIQEAELANGDKIDAGRTRFLITIDGQTRTSQPPSLIDAPSAEVPPAVEPEPVVALKSTSKQQQILTYLQTLASTTTLFGIMDAAREPSILMRLHKHGEQCQSLYEGEKGQSLAPYGPWLVRLPSASPLLVELVNEGWGQSWGIFLTSMLSFADVRKHFRHFLKVQLPDGRHVFFRYYDPRVLRTYLASSLPQDLKEFYGTMQRFVMEAEEGNAILEYTPHSKGAMCIALT